MKSFLLIKKNGSYYLVSLRYKMILNISKILYYIIDTIEQKKQKNVFSLIQSEFSMKISKRDFQNQNKKYHLFLIFNLK